MFAGLLAAPVIPRAQYTTPTAQSVGDPRLVRLQRFLHDNNCPIKRLAGDFIEAADHHELDWRLLPSIAVIESGGGKRYKNNNVFGWDNGRERFPSVRAGIHIVARKLANSPMYKDKDTEHILRTYNPKRQDYSRRVKAVMELIALREEYAGGLN